MQTRCMGNLAMGLPTVAESSLIPYAHGAHPNGALRRRSVMPRLQAGEIALLALMATATTALVVFCGWRDSQAFPPISTDAAALYRGLEQ